jgi:hypothetical protein
MGMVWCRAGEHSFKVAFEPSHGEMWCDEHGCFAGPMPQEKKSGFRGAGESADRKRARQRFNRAVKSHGCFYSRYRPSGPPAERPRREGHTCTRPLDAHHLVEKQWIERNFADLPEDELLAILFDPRLGCPLCRAGHEGVKRLRIFWDEVSEDAKEAAREIDARYFDQLTPAGLHRESMYARLRKECPTREEAR